MSEKTATTATTNQFKVNYDKNADNLADALGISSDRCDALCGRVHDEMEKVDHLDPSNIMKVISAASEECKNANEVAFISCEVDHHFTLHALAGNSIASMLRSLTGEDVANAN
jgi:hypothetical protein